MYQAGYCSCISQNAQCHSVQRRNRTGRHKLHITSCNKHDSLPTVSRVSAHDRHHAHDRHCTARRSVDIMLCAPPSQCSGNAAHCSGLPCSAKCGAPLCWPSTLSRSGTARSPEWQTSKSPAGTRTICQYLISVLYPCLKAPEGTEGVNTYQPADGVPFGRNIRVTCSIAGSLPRRVRDLGYSSEA